MAERSSLDGRVLAVDAGEALVALPAGGCAACAGKSGCGIGRLAGERPARVVRVPACAGLQPGDAVVLEADAAALARAALLGYLVPAVGIVGGSVAGDLATGMEAGAVAGALAGFLFGLAAVRVFARRGAGLVRQVARPPQR